MLFKAGDNHQKLKKALSKYAIRFLKGAVLFEQKDLKTVQEILLQDGMVANKEAVETQFDAFINARKLTRFLTLSLEGQCNMMRHLPQRREEKLFTLGCEPGNNYRELQTLLLPFTLDTNLLYMGWTPLAESTLPEVKEILLRPGMVDNPNDVEIHFDKFLEVAPDFKP